MSNLGIQIPNIKILDFSNNIYFTKLFVVLGFFFRNGEVFGFGFFFNLESKFELADCQILVFKFQTLKY